MDPKDAVLKMVMVLRDHPDMQMLEYDCKETGLHVKVERVQPLPKGMKLLISPN